MYVRSDKIEINHDWYWESEETKILVSENCISIHTLLGTINNNVSIIFIFKNIPFI